MSVILYTKPNCVQCSATERALQQQKIPFTAVDLTQDTQALAKIVSMGYRQVPVVVTLRPNAGCGARPRASVCGVVP